jgi:hypothetical protein
VKEGGRGEEPPEIAVHGVLDWREHRADPRCGPLFPRIIDPFPLLPHLIQENLHRNGKLVEFAMSWGFNQSHFRLVAPHILQVHQAAGQPTHRQSVRDLVTFLSGRPAAFDEKNSVYLGLRLLPLLSRRDS